MTEDEKELLDFMIAEHRKEGLTLLAEAQVENLKHYYQNYGKCPFKPGDFVTPKAFSSHVHRNRPYIVLEVRENSEPDLSASDVTSNVFGRRVNIRVGAYVNNNIISEWWGESFEFERWPG